jgi:hypothetical protein
MNQPSTNRSGARHHSVGGQFLARHAEQRCAMLGEKAGLLKAALVHHCIDPFPRGELAGLAVLFELVRAAALHHRFPLLAKRFDPFFHRVGHEV